MTSLLYASTKNSDMLYAAQGFISDEVFLLTLNKASYLFIDQREYGIFAERNTSKHLQLVLLDPLLDEASKRPEQTSLRNKLALVLFDRYELWDQDIAVATHFPLDLADFLRSKGAKLTVKNPFFPERAQKSSTEVKAMTSALTRTKKAFARIEEVLGEAKIIGKRLQYEGQILTSEFLKREVESIFAQDGLMSTDGKIISCFKQAAIPHHEGTGALLSHQTIICDLFPRDIATGYYADMTRTYVKGEPSEEQRKMYQAVLGAQEVAFKAIKPGVSTRAVHEAVRKYFLQAGYDVGDKGFTHGTGHSLGLDIHETPSFSSRSDEVLREGVIMTVEPGLYYPAIGGVRIEDVVVVTKTGYRNLTNHHKQFVIS